jgi:hypothetical protein
MSDIALAGGATTIQIALAVMSYDTFSSKLSKNYFKKMVL